MKSKGGVSNEISGVALNSLEDMKQAHNDGTTVLMMIDSQMFDDIVSYSYNDLFTQSHWIVYEGGLSFYNTANKLVKEIGKATTLSFKFATWGKEPEESLNLLSDKQRVSVRCFKSTFYGFIICRDYLPRSKKYADSYLKA